MMLVVLHGDGARSATFIFIYYKTNSEEKYPFGINHDACGLTCNWSAKRDLNIYLLNIILYKIKKQLGLRNG
jgi:hypothetical protein